MNTSLVLLILVWCGNLNYNLSFALASCKLKNTGKSNTKTEHQDSKIFSPSTAARSRQLAPDPVFYGYPNAGSDGPIFYQPDAGSNPYYAPYMGSGFPYPGINQGSLGAGIFYFYPDAAPTVMPVPVFNGDAPHVKGNKDKRTRHNGCHRSKKINHQETIDEMKQTRSSPEEDSQR